MAFEWDAGKNAGNLAKHGIEFADASRLFEGPVLERLDDREDYGETRIAAARPPQQRRPTPPKRLRRPGCRCGGWIGVVEGRELFVVYTMRGETRRIISARKANRHERQAYRKAVRAHQGED